MINIVVCVKQVIDTEIGPAYFKLDEEVKRALRPLGSQPILNPFDENALEAALMIRDSLGAQQSKITVVSMGRRLAKALLRKTLAVGADDLIVLEDDIFDSFDSYKTVEWLVAAIRRIGTYDLVLCGRQAADTNAGQVGFGIAEMLEIPCISAARKIEIEGEELIVERITSDGYDVLKTSMPALITVSSEVGELRFPTVMALRAAQKKEIRVWKREDICSHSIPPQRTDLVRLFIPPVVSKTACEMVDGVDAEAAGKNLALRLREAGLL
jgi:electron transfer flavoprotein beta subunit